MPPHLFGCGSAALCDVYPPRMEKLKSMAQGAKTFNDHRELLALKEVDIVLVGSPDHWHKDHACDAMNAEKDVYCEKPLCRLRSEAPEMVRTARVTGRICQIGLQQRSGEIYREPLDKFVRSGALGRITHIDAVWHGGVVGPMRTEPAVKPPDLDWIRFLGPVLLARRFFSAREDFLCRHTCLVAALPRCELPGVEPGPILQLPQLPRL